MKEWTVVQWFYRRFICPKKGHKWKIWMSLGLPAHPYCTNCGEFDPGWKPSEKNYSWKIKEEDSGKTTVNS